MDAISDQIRAELVEAVRWTAEFSGRSAQTHLGPSEIGHPCDRQLAYKLAGRPRVHYSDPLPAFIGTGGHAALQDVFESYGGESYQAWQRWQADPADEDAARAALLAPYRDNPRYRVETRVEVPGLGPGTCDLFDTYRRTTIDHKWVGAWSMNQARTYGPSPAHRVQGHTYGLGWEHETGEAPDRVAIAYWPRERSTKHGVVVRLDYVWVWSEPYNRAVAEEAIARVDRINERVAELDTDRFPSLLGSFTAAPYACRFCDWYDPNAADPGQGCTGI